MKNLNQIKLIQNVLDKKRDNLLNDLSKINVYLNQKITSLHKIIAYQNEYAEGNYLNMTRSVPMLSKNLDIFTKKMKEIIHAEQKEIDKIVIIQKNKVNEIDLIDKKLKIMSGFSQSILLERSLRNDTLEQIGMDDLSTIKKSRGNHE